MRESVSGVQKPKKFTNHRAIHSCSASQYADDILLKVLLEIIKKRIRVFLYEHRRMSYMDDAHINVKREAVGN